MAAPPSPPADLGLAARSQPGILAPGPRAARYLWFAVRPDHDPGPALARLARARAATDVVGIGAGTAQRLGGQVPGLREPLVMAGAGVAMPATPGHLWLWLRGEDPGELLHRGDAIRDALADGFAVDAALDAFEHGGGRDLTGYEDGTENPRGAEAVSAALVDGAGPGLDGGSFVAVQIWQHDLARFRAFAAREQDAIIGRRRDDNAELSSAPASAHVRRTAQEDFDPAAFVLRRSMPWIAGTDAGLVFVAFGRSFDAFEALCRRMVGLDDGIPDALFRFTRPRTTAYFWCPPVGPDGSLDLRALAR